MRILSIAFSFLSLLSMTSGQVNTKSRVRTKPAAGAYDVAAVNNAATRGDLQEKATGSAALRVQILLDRASFSLGEIDGVIGANTIRAIVGFRAARGLPAGPIVDADLWKALGTDTSPALLVEYTISADDLRGPFVKVPVDMMRKARLKALGYSSAVEGLGEEFHITPALLQKLNPGSRFSAAGQKIYAPNIGMPPEAKAARVVVSKSEAVVKVLNDQGSVVAQYPATMGSERDPLPLGDWLVTGVFKNPKFNYNPELFWDANPAHSKATIAAGPNNPVGLVWIDLSKEHYGIHGTPSPGQIGHTESHGCIRLTNWDALALAGMVGKGTPVRMQD